MHPPPAYWTRDHLHRTRGVIAPAANGDSKTTASGREQRCMPAQKTLFGERRSVALRRVQHHLDDSFDCTIDRSVATQLDAEVSGNGGPNRIWVQVLSLDLAGFDHVLGEGSHFRLLLQRAAQVFHAPEQSSLLKMQRGQQFRKLLAIPAKTGP